MKRININTSDEYYAEVKRIAESTGISMSSFVIMCIMNYFKEQQAFDVLKNIKYQEIVNATTKINDSKKED